MPTLTIKNFPNKLLRALRRKAETSRRSMTQEILRRLEHSVTAGDSGDGRAPGHRQLASWSKLSGKWKSDVSVVREIDALYRARKRGRKIKL